MKNMKSKLLALGMATMMVASATGCSFSFSFGGSKFSKASNKMVKSAEEACGAEKVSSKQRKAILKGGATSGGFEDGAYMKFSSSEAEGFELVLQCAEAGDLKNVTIFYKIDDNFGIMAAVYELDDKDLAEEYYEELVETADDSLFSDERMGQLDATFSDHEFGIDDEKDDEYLAIQRTEEGDGCDIVYAKMDGKVVTYVYCTMEVSSDLYDESLEFLEGIGCQDPEELL